MGRPRKTEAPVKTERKPRTKKVPEPEVIKQDPIIEAEAEPKKEVTPGIYIVSVASMLNVRSGPSKDNEIKRQLKNGTEVTVSKVDGDWGMIGKGEWVMTDFLVSKYF